MKLAQIIGNVALLYLVYLISKDFLADKVKQAYLCSLIAAILLTPIVNTFWTISIISLPFLFIFLYRGFSCLALENYRLATVFFFLSTFTSGQGFLFIGPAFVLLGFLTYATNNYSLRKFYFIASCILIVGLFLVSIYLPNSNSSGSVSLAGSDSILVKFVSFFSFLGGHWNQFSFIVATNSAINLGVLTFLVFTYCSIRGIIQKDILAMKISAFGLFFILLAVLATISRLSDNQFDDITISSRYYIHSILFLICTLTLYINAFKLSFAVHVPLLCVILLCYSIRLTSEHRYLHRSHKLKEHVNKGVILNDDTFNHVSKHPSRHYEIKKAIEHKLYEIPTHYLPKNLHDTHIKSNRDELKDRSIIISKHFNQFNSLWIEYMTARKYTVKSEHILMLNNQDTGRKYYFEPQIVDLSKFERDKYFKNSINTKTFNDYKTKYSVFLPSQTLSLDDGTYSIKLFIQVGNKCYWKKIGSLNIEQDKK